MATPSVSSLGHSEELDPQRWKALGVVLVASFMLLLDISIVNVAIPSIQRSVGATYSQIEWVLAGYQLSYAVTLITGGRLGDIFGRKRLFMIGVGGFTLASAACGLAQSGTFLVGARVAQGFMAALMYPQVFSVIQVNFPPQERAKAFGLTGAVIGLATVTGPLAGGLLIQGNLFGWDWRPVFLVNVPIGIGAVIAAVFLLHESKAPSAPKLDIPGVVIATLGLFLMAYPLVEGRDAGWPLWTYAMLAGSVLVLGIFWLYNRRRAATIGNPLVEPGLFRDRAFVVGLLVTFVFISGVPAFFLTFSLFLQIGHGFTALQTGLTTLPFAVGSAFASGMSIRLAPKLGKRILLLGAALIDTGMVLLLLTLNLMGEPVLGYYLIPALAVAGLGMGCVIAPLVNIILSGIHHGNAGSASGVLTTVQQVGGAIGVTIIGVIFFGLLSGHASDIAGASTPQLTQRLIVAGIPPGAPVNAAVIGYNTCFLDRSAASDPTSDPASCQAAQRSSSAFAQSDPALATRVQDIFKSEATNRLADDFSFSFERAVTYNLVAWALTFVLVFLLPASKPRSTPTPAAA